MFAYCNNNPINRIDFCGYYTSTLANFSDKHSSFACHDVYAGGGGIIIVPGIFLDFVFLDAIAETRNKIIAYVKSAKVGQIRDQSVYILTNLDGEVRYVGRTNDPVRRAIEHKNDPLHPWRKDYILTVVATGLTVDEARFVEQAFISAFSVIYLENARREISRKNMPGFYKNANAFTELVGGVPLDELFILMGE